MKATYEKVRRFPGVGKWVERLAQPFSLNYVQTVKAQLDEVSSSMCAAKWLQSTLHLESGETHSCHHTPRHAVADGPSGLHNTPEKKLARAQMLNGERPAECGYCWPIEDLGKLSDRHYKSSEDWARGAIPRLAKLPAETEVVPTYLEVSFSSACQLKCSYCDPNISSAIRADFTKFGTLPGLPPIRAVSDGDLHRENFWNWWPTLKYELHTLRITGGEPLLQEDTFQLLTDFEKSPAPNLSLSVNSNLVVPAVTFERFLTLAKRTSSQVRELHLFASIDTWGDQAEYLRDGLDFKLFQERLETCLRELPAMPITLLVTFNALSPFQYPQLLEYVVWLRRRYPNSSLKVGASLLHSPHFLALDLLPPAFETVLHECLCAYDRLSSAKIGSTGFTPSERARFERMISWWREQGEKPQLRSDFQRFVAEYDRRRNKDFKTAFPELAEFYGAAT